MLIAHKIALALNSATVSRVADRWFVSITVDARDPLVHAENQGVIGVDLGISALATIRKSI